MKENEFYTKKQIETLGWYIVCSFGYTYVLSDGAGKNSIWNPTDGRVIKVYDSRDRCATQ